MKKVPFTPFQLVLTVVNTVALMFCMGCDCFVLIVGMTAGRTKPYVVDLVLSLLAMAVFILLVFSAGRINIFSDKADPDGPEWLRVHSHLPRRKSEERSSHGDLSVK